jgi:hypothetical protein
MKKKSLLVALCVLIISGCNADDRVGLTLLFLNLGKDSISVTRFDIDGRKFGGPGGLGGWQGKDPLPSDPEWVLDGAQMSYMPERGKGPSVPEVVDVEWMVVTPAIEQARVSRDKSFTDYSPGWMAATEQINKMTPSYAKRINLNTLLTPALIEQVKANRHGTQLKLVIKFNNDQVDIKAKAEKWR